MAIKITTDGSVNYTNQPNVNRVLFPNEINTTEVKEKLTSLEGDVSELKDLTEIETVTLGSEGINETYVSRANIYFVKYGKVVQMSGWLELKAGTIPGGSVLFDNSALFAPVTNAHLYGILTNNIIELSISLNTKQIKTVGDRTLSSVSLFEIGGCYICS